MLQQFVADLCLATSSLVMEPVDEPDDVEAEALAVELSLPVQTA